MSGRPLISVLHPTRRVSPSEAFPYGWQAAWREWLGKADVVGRIEYVIAVHESRWEEFWQHAPYPFIRHDAIQSGWVFRFPSPVGPAGAIRADYVVVRNPYRDCAVDQINCAADAASGEILTGAQDDFYPPEHWDTQLLLSIPNLDPDPEVVVICSSGASPERDRELMLAGAVTRNVYERRGWQLHWDFESMFADNHYAWQNRQDEHAGLLKIVERLDIVFRHEHPCLGYGLVAARADEAYQQQNNPEAYRQGLATLRRLTEGTRVLAVLLPGEQFSHEWVVSWFNLLLHLNSGSRFIVGNHWCHSSSVFATRMELTRSACTAIPLADLVLWADDDNLLSIPQFEMLLADLDAHPELAGVVAWCLCDSGDVLGTKGKVPVMSCGRQGPHLKCLPFTEEDYKSAIQSERWLISSDDIAPDAFWSGFPVVLMRASALRQLGAQSFLPMLIPEVQNGMTSEDTTFFYRAHELGLKFAVDLRVEVPHLKLRAVHLAQYPRLQVEMKQPASEPCPSDSSGLQQPGELMGASPGEIEDSVTIAGKMARGLTVELL